MIIYLFILIPYRGTLASSTVINLEVENSLGEVSISLKIRYNVFLKDLL